MQQNETLQNIIALIEQGCLGRAVLQVENFLLTHPAQSDMEQLIAIKEDCRLMTDYWQRGYDDPQRPQVFHHLLRRLYMLVTNMIIHDRLRNSSYLKGVYSRPRQIRKDWSITSIRQALESFVSDVAMLGLEPEHTRQQKSSDVYKEHQLLMHDLFDYILTSRLWKDALSDAFTEMLLLPTIDVIDRQLIVSAITIAALQAFGFNKFRVLFDVYRKAEEPELRQRALVGWVLVASAKADKLYPEQRAMMAEAVEDEQCRRDLIELQMQLIYCMDAEDDQRIIKDEIMPDIINGSNIKVTRQGLVEMDEDTLEDIIHPEAAEQNMERMEQSMHRMVDMQKQGSDIYYGGFAQMKRFPFYNDLSNWFVPFYPQHPAIANIWQQTKGKKFLQIVTKVGAFCDSDKYSFVLAFDQVISRLPKNMLKMVEDGEATPTPVGGEISLEDQRQPAFMRRVYLQNLYRFYHLHPVRSEFRSPFNGSSYLFFANPLFQGTALEKHFQEVAAFLLKRRRYDDALAVLTNTTSPANEFQHQLLMGSVLQRLPESPFMSAASYFRKALAIKPDNQKALAGFARATFREQNFEAALEAYEKLLLQQPESKAYQLNKAICLNRLGRNEDAQKVLFKLNYLYPEDLNVSRVLAWTLTENGKLEQAQKLYTALLSDEHPQPEDLLNNGYCLWFERQIVSAIGMFRQYIDCMGEDNRPDMEREFMQTEHDVISRHGISETEIQLMLDALQVI